MPYGYTGSEALPPLSKPTPNPLVSSTVPLVCRLSPLQPGYVITMCACTIEVRKEEMKANAHMAIEDRGSMVFTKEGEATSRCLRR